MTEIRPGVLVGERATPIDSVACYSPRGKGSFPVVTLMTAIPAVVAGVPSPVILTPPGADGEVDPATLVAARIAGIDTVCKAGGAQAVAAAAFGTNSVPRCHKIVGPGSPWLVAAKRLLSGQIDPGLPAGPSETILLADPSANAHIAALDLCIESEHGPDSGAFLVTWDRKLAEHVCELVPAYWARMGDTLAQYSSTVLSGKRGGVVLAANAQEAYDFVNDYAPEHCQVLSKTPFEHLSHVRNASEILLGEHAAGSLANYLMGPNCVLPTAAGARTHSPLGVPDFMKTCSVGHVTDVGYKALAPHTHRFACYEGFDGHANAVSVLRDAAHAGQAPGPGGVGDCTEQNKSEQNAMDAAIAACAMQCVVEPGMTGIGGDCFAMLSAGSGTPIAFNGSGRAPGGATLEALKARGVTSIERASPHSVVVPGSIDAWTRLHADHGRMPFAELLAPAIRTAREGYPLSSRIAVDTAKQVDFLQQHHPRAAALYLDNGTAPAVGSVRVLPDLADTLEVIAREGREGFYRGALADGMVDELQSLGGLHTLDDFARVSGDYVTPTWR